MQQCADNEHLEMRLQAERHSDHEKELKDYASKMKQARDGVYMADRHQQRKMNKVLNEFDSLAWDVERTELATLRVWTELEGCKDDLPLPVLAAAQRAQDMIADTSKQLTSTRKAAEGAVVDGIQNVREAQTKHVGRLMWGEPAKAGMY